MGNFARLFALIASIVVSAAANAAVVSAPDGWQADPGPETLTWTKPSAKSDLDVGIAFDRIETATEPLLPWFKAMGDELVAAGVVSERRGVAREGELVKDEFLLTLNGERMRAFVFGYQTAKGKQAIMVAVDPGLDRSDPTLRQAFDIVARAQRQQMFYADHKLFALMPDPSAGTRLPRPAASTPPFTP